MTPSDREAAGRQQSVAPAIDRSAAQGVGFRLDPGERVVWTGKPRQGFVFRPIDILVSIFGLPFLVMPLTMWSGPVAAEIGTCLRGNCNFQKQHVVHFTLPHVILGCYLVLGRFFVDRWHRHRLEYAVTDRRLVVHRKGGQTVTVLYKPRPDLSLVEHGDRGTIMFEHTTSFPFTFQYSWLHTTIGSSRRFFEIEDAGRVFRLIEDQINRQAGTE